MLTVLIDIAIGLTAAMVAASLTHSARAFAPAFRRLHAEVLALETAGQVRISLHDTGASPACALVYRPEFGAAEIRAKAAGLPLQPALPRQTGLRVAA